MLRLFLDRNLRFRDQDQNKRKKMMEATLAAETDGKYLNLSAADPKFKSIISGFCLSN